MSFLVFENRWADHRGISMGNIRRGVAQSAQIGYWMGEPMPARAIWARPSRLILDHASRDAVEPDRGSLYPEE
jgi:[ribosomal protein S5]-alanine N-acetyltransferase